VYENVAFGLQVRRVPKAEARRRVQQTLDLVDLTGLDTRYPNQLSGGQQQRVALARSLVVEPRILLLDEPLSNLDAKLREHMRWELKALQRRTGITFVYVTHDQSEAMALSDHIAVMYAGHLQQFGTPRDVYTHPANRTVADFMGLVNLVAACVLDPSQGEVVFGSSYRLRVTLPAGLRTGQEVQLAIRPENIQLARNSAPSSGVLATVEEATFLGNMNDYSVSLGGTRLRV
jgi:iron(III) transport system ATP-binding protein